MWVFGYGSLIWNPNFEYIQKEIAILDGYKRDFCIKTSHHRGNEQQYGIVLGLYKKENTSTTGYAFKVENSKIAETLDYLQERELCEDCYHQKIVNIKIKGNLTEAVTFVTNENSKGYLKESEICLIEKSKIISIAEGYSGKNIDYYLNTVKKLKDIGVREDFFEIEKHLKK